MTDGAKNIPVKASMFSSGWTIPTVGDNAFKANYYGTTTSAIKIKTSAKPGCDSWNDYLITGYANLISTASANHRIGYITRYQDVNNYYFIGFKTDTTGGNGNSTYEVYEKNTGTYTRLENQYDTGYNDESDPNPANWDVGIPETVGTGGVLSANTQYHLRVDLYGSVCRMFIQNVLVYENRTGFTTFTEGEIGLEAFTQSSDTIIATFDTIKVVS